MVRKSDRIIAAHLEGNPKVCIISAYAPTETSSDEAKNSFYDDLSEVLLSIPPHTVVVLTGDFNARLGRDSYTTNKRVIGNNCYHSTTNDNGQRLIDLCESMDLRPAHTHFKHRKSRLSTYRDPKGNFYQIDHIAISQKWWKSLRDCRAYNILDIGSDHKVVSAHIKLSLRAEKKKANNRCKFMTEKLSDAKTCKDFDLKLKNRFESLFDEALCEDKQDEIQKRSDALNNALQTTSERILGKRPKKKQPNWVSSKTLQLMDAQGKAKAAYKQSQLAIDKKLWRQIQNQVSSAYSKDQSAYEEAQLKALELADRKHECSTTWKIINEMTEKPTIAAASKVRMTDVSIPKYSNERLCDWCNYFSTLLNNKNPYYDPAYLPTPSPDNPKIPVTYITREEVKNAINDFKKGKSPGPDYAMTAEVLQTGGAFIVDEINTICQLVFKERHAPTQWTSSMMIPLPKKGNLELKTNFRGICLTSIAAKVYNRVILNRIREPIDAILRRNQAGFRKGRSCIQQIHILRRIMEGASSQDIPLFITFIDFMKAFDSIDREMMFAILRHYGIPEQIVSAIRVLYDDSTSRVYVEGEFSEAFKITTGVLQGDVLAPFLFIIVIDYVSKQSEEDFGYVTHKGSAPRTSQRPTRSTSAIQCASERKLNDLAFADDVALLENSAVRAQKQLDAYKENAAKVGLRLNIKKTEQMQLNQPKDANITKLVVDGQEIAVVDDFKYLGSYVGSTEKDVNTRIALAWVAFARLKPLLRASRPTIEFKIRLFNAACISILLYGCESWVLTEPLKKKLDTFARTCYRIILGVKQVEVHMKNDELYKKVSQYPIRDQIRERQLKFTGHCLRMDKEELAYIYIFYKSEIRQNKRGRANTNYHDQISTHLTNDAKVRLEVDQIARMARDKIGWFQSVAPKKPAR